jgi:hypothetical protein
MTDTCTRASIGLEGSLSLHSAAADLAVAASPTRTDAGTARVGG